MGDVLGALSLALELFSVSIEAYKIISTATAVGDSASKYLVKFRIEETRLQYWGLAMGSSSGTMDGNLEKLELKGLVVAILAEVAKTLLEVEKLKTIYGLSWKKLENSFATGNPNGNGQIAFPSIESLVDPIGSTNHVADNVRRLKTFSKQVKSSLSVMKKLRFSIADATKFNELANLLAYYNTNLRGLMTDAQQFTLNNAVDKTTLEPAGSNVNALQQIRDASKDSASDLSTTAELKRHAILLNDPAAKRKMVMEENGLEKPFLSANSLRLKMSLFHISTSDKEKPRFMSMYGPANDKVKVFVEMKVYSDHLQQLDHNTEIDRIQDIAWYLHESSIARSPKFLVPECLGYLDVPGVRRFYLLYSIPWTTSRIVSLKDLILDGSSDDSAVPNLEIRVKIALGLALTLHKLHLTSWLHKSIRPDNILFLEGSSANPDLTKPTLVGFEYSRPNELTQHSDSARNRNRRHDVYKHPECQGEVSERFKSVYDMYSLGVVLMEIGFWKPAEKLAEVEENNYAEITRRKLLEKAESELGGKMGSRYLEAVTSCLNVNSYEGNEQLMEQVVLQLMQLEGL